MPGYNHFSDCSCGWCDKSGLSRADRGRALDDLRKRDARTFLDRNSARSFSACYVNPNARCPVCKKSVFFYANAHGSRVYFDDLGPPWPKHPCTDNPRRPIDSEAVTHGVITRRAKGLTRELIDSANMAGLLRSKQFGKRTAGDWTLLVIDDVVRRGDENHIRAEFLDSIDQQKFEFSCYSAEPVLHVGDFIARNQNEISFLQRTILRPITFIIGSRIPEEPEDVIAPRRMFGVARTRTQHLIRATEKAEKARPSDHGSIKLPRQEPSASEMAHFRSKSVTLPELCEKLGPIVKTYARAGIRKPRDVAPRLNTDGHRTASGAQWTPHLAYFLLGFLFDNNSPVRVDGKSHGAKKSEGQPTTKKTRGGRASNFDEPRQPLTAEELARRRAALVNRD